MSDQRPYPHDLEAERAILGACMTDRRCLDRVREAGLEAEHFYRQDHRRLFAALLKAHAAGVPIDDLALMHDALDGGDWLRFGGLTYVFELPNSVVSTANVELYAEIVVTKSRLGAMLEATEQVREAAFDGRADPDELAATLATAALAVPSSRARGWRRMSDILPESLKKAEAAQAAPARHGGISTGFKGIDEKTGGMHAGDLVILAGRPGKGKTALALNICEIVATAGHNVGVFSLEMTADSLAQRTLSGMSGASARDLRTGQVNPHFLFKLRQLLADNPEHLDRLHVDDRPATVSQIAARARQLQQALKHEVGDEEEELRLLVVDYLQIVDTEAHLARAKREVQVAFMSKSLKTLAKQLGCTVIALAQLNRKVEERADSTPVASDLRESGAVEQDADIILLVSREGSDATVTIAKCRNGETGAVTLHFQGRTTTFSDAGAQEPAEDRSEGWGAEAP